MQLTRLPDLDMLANTLIANQFALDRESVCILGQFSYEAVRVGASKIIFCVSRCTYFREVLP